MLRKLWKWLAASLSVVVILLGVFVGLFRLLLPLIPHYHERIEAFASEAAGTAVEIGTITARWSFDGPELRFLNARFLTADGEETLLSAAEGRVVLDLGALLSDRELRAGQVLLEGLMLEVGRDKAGQWHVGGRRLAAADGSLPQRLALGLRHSKIVFRDEIRGVGPWIFDDVELNVELQNRHLSIDSEMRLPPGLGRVAELSLEADGDMADVESLQWQVYLRGDDIDLFGWSPLMTTQRIAPTSGRGDVVFWFASQGKQLQQASLQTDLRDVILTRGTHAARELDLVQGRVEYDRIDQGWQATGRDVVIESDGHTWPVSTFSIEQVGALPEYGLLYADFSYARLDDLTPFLDWWPESGPPEWLIGLSPRGVVEQLSFRMTRRDGKLESYTLRGRFDGLGFDAHKPYPGLDALSGDLRVDDHGGRLQLAPRAVRIDLPDVLGQALETQRLSGTVVWRRGPGGWRIVSDSIDIDHEQFRSATSFELTLGDDKKTSLDLHSVLGNLSLNGARGLLPRPIMTAPVVAWVDRAFLGGEVPAASVEWSGPLDAFPFDNGEGEFRATAEVRNGLLDYRQGWPAAREIDGTVVFHNASIRGAVDRAQLAGNIVTGADLSIADFRRPVLEFHSEADGQLDNMHTFLKNSPVAQDSRDIVNRLSFAGSGTVQVDLEIPLSRKLGLRPDVSVQITTQAGEAALAGLPHSLEQIAGGLTFHNGQFSANAINAQLLGAPVVIDVVPDTVDTGEQRYKATKAIARGQVSERELARLHELLPTMVSGSTPFSATVTLPDRAAQRPLDIEIVSSLDGMAITLPAPMNKRATTRRDFVLKIALPEAAAQTDIRIGNLANARLNWLRGDGWTFDRGGLQFGATPASLPNSAGLEIAGSVDVLDASAWLGRIGDWAKHNESQGPGLLQDMQITAGTLELYGQTLSDARLSVDRSEREWLVQIDSAMAAGALFVPFSLNDKPIIANMQVLHINLDQTNAAETVEHDPREIPSMVVEVDDFKLGALDLGALKARLTQEADGIILEEFTTDNPSFSARGSGDWEMTHNGQRSRVQVNLLSSDVARTLERLGFEGMIHASDASFELALNWPGPPGAGFREKLDGMVTVKVGPGQLDTVQPGAGRALGLLSFTALPRRLSLDFRDVFDKGFGFDFIQGDFRLDDGNAYTTNLVLEGPAAQVGITGRAGLVARDYDQLAVVYGNFGATLPVAGALAGGPIGGAAMLIFSELFKRPLQNMARSNYRITGSWDDPSVERVLAQSDEAS